MNKTILLIAGLDPSGCAGIAADLKTCMAWDAYGAPVVTTVTAQNTQKVTAVYQVSAEAIRAQFEAVVSDIDVHAVKIGLLTESTNFELLASLLQQYRLTNIVVDPVLRSTTGFVFSGKPILNAYREKLFPFADVITPNIDEASALTGLDVKDVAGMKEAAVKLHALGARNVVITGGHLQSSAVDVLYDGSGHELFEAPKIEPANVRGLGCTFSTILAVHLARQESLPVAIRAAKDYIARGIVQAHKIGKGRGPINHWIR